MNTLKIFANIFLVAMFLLSSYTFAQGKTDSTKTKHKMMHHQHDMMKDSTMQLKMHDMKMMKDSTMQLKMHDMKMMKDSTHQMMMKNKKEMMDKMKSPLIREGEIDLEAIDENKDGKVYQDVMDWNVISDKPGKCPLCNMKLKEVSLDKAKENLLKNGFKVK
ncbi:MAG: heavy metal-binding domain-containing protein [Stygiobacter sp.]